MKIFPGTQITDKALLAISSELKLVHLDISDCFRLSDDAIDHIANSSLVNTLEHLDIRYCTFSAMILPMLTRMKMMSKLLLSHPKKIPEGGY